MQLIEHKEELKIQVSNVSPYIPVEDISSFFKKGYSSKGKNRGLGLYELKKISQEYGFDIVCSNDIVEEFNWLTFCLKIKKPAV